MQGDRHLPGRVEPPFSSGEALVAPIAVLPTECFVSTANGASAAAAVQRIVL